MDRPPESGIIQFCVPLAPVSLQAASAKRSAFQANLKKYIPRTKFLLSGDVKIEVEWFIHEAARYEADSAPDIDNILKPLSDVLRGPNGILIDDNQIQAIGCSWIDWTSSDEMLNIELRFFSDEFVDKEALVFVGIANSLYIPINESLPTKELCELLDVLKRQWELRSKFLKLGYDYYEAKSVTSIQRFFHRSRLSGFNLIEFEILRERLDKILKNGT